MKKILPLALAGGAAVLLLSSGKKKKKKSNELAVDEEIIIKEAESNSKARESKAEVKRQQTILKKISKGLGNSEMDPGKVDGIKGENTVMAIIALQKQAGLDADGIWDIEVERAAEMLLESVSSAGGTKTSVSRSGITLGRVKVPWSFSGDIINMVQNRLRRGEYGMESRDQAIVDMVQVVEVDFEGRDTRVANLPEGTEKDRVMETLIRSVDQAFETYGGFDISDLVR